MIEMNWYDCVHKVRKATEWVPLLFEMDKVMRIAPLFNPLPTLFATCIPMLASEGASVTSHLPTHYSFLLALTPGFQLHLQLPLYLLLILSKILFRSVVPFLSANLHSRKICGFCCSLQFDHRS